MPRQPAKSAPAQTATKASPKALPFPTSESVKGAKPAAAAAKKPAVKAAAAAPAAVAAPKAAAKPEVKAAEKESTKPVPHKSVYPFEIHNKALRKLWLQCQPGET